MNVNLMRVDGNYGHGRIYAFDIIRAIAIIGIVACHICYATGLMVTGQYLGGTFNAIFFVISALLLGRSANKCKFTGRVYNSLIFMIKCFIRLESSLLPFLLLCGIIFHSAHIPFRTIAFFENIFMLGWFAKLPGLGHLWFVTMIMVCYVMFSILRKNPLRYKHVRLWLLFIPSQIVLELCNLPGYFFLVLMYCGLFLSMQMIFYIL